MILSIMLLELSKHSGDNIWTYKDDAENFMTKTWNICTPTQQC